MAWPVAVDTTLRDELLIRLDRARPRVQLLRGPAGVGKTTLAAAVADGLRERGVTVLPILALQELTEVPLAAMAPTLGALGAPEALAVAERVQQLFARVAADAGRFALFIDDGPLLDGISASTVYQLTRTTGVRCLITARTGSTLPSALQRLGDEGFVETTTVAELAPSTAGALAEQALGGAVEPDSLRRLVATAGGNPLFLRELVGAAIDGGAIERTARGIVVDPAILPARIVDAVGDRLERLDPAERHVAELIAVAAPWVDRELAAPAQVERLMVAELAQRDSTGAVYLAHPVIAEVVVARMPADRLAARRVEAASLLDAEAGDATRFRIDALLADTEAPPAPGELAWAANYAYLLTDHQLAVTLADRALREGELTEALLVRAMALSALKDPEADHAFDRARDSAIGDRARVQVECAWARHEAIVQQRPGSALRHERELLPRIVESVAREQLEDDIARWSLVTGDGPFPAPRPADGETGIASIGVLAYEVMFAAQASDFPRARAALDEAQRRAGGSPAAAPVLRVLDLFRFRALAYEEGLLVAHAFAEQRASDVFADEVGMWTNALATTELHVGWTNAAWRHAQVAVQQLRWRDVTGALAAAEALLATLAAQRGDDAAALANLATAPTGDVKEMLQRVETTAWLRLRQRDAEGAGEALVEAGERAVAMHAVAVAAPTVYLAVRMGQAQRALDLLRRIGASAQSALIAAMLSHAEAAASGDPAALLRAVPRLAEVGLLAGAVDAAGLAARRFRAAGSLEQERRAGLLGARWSREVGGYRGLGRERTPFDLSPREWEIGRAAAGRERSREIADRLGLSTRTVDNHLARIYRKLGIAGRDELRDALAD